MRKEIGAHVKLRHVPQVIIEIDETIEKAIHLEGLFKQIKTKDKKQEDLNEEDDIEEDSNDEDSIED
jgi:ribosome-binding factor A